MSENEDSHTFQQKKNPPTLLSLDGTENQRTEKDKEQGT